MNKICGSAVVLALDFQDYDEVLEFLEEYHTGSHRCMPSASWRGDYDKMKGLYEVLTGEERAAIWTRFKTFDDEHPEFAGAVRVLKDEGFAAMLAESTFTMADVLEANKHNPDVQVLVRTQEYMEKMK